MDRLRLLMVLMVVAAAVVLLAAPDVAPAQCAMCKQSVAASTDAEQAARGLNLAVLVLLLPPVSIFMGVFALFYRYNNVQGSEARDYYAERDNG